MVVMSGIFMLYLVLLGGAVWSARRPMRQSLRRRAAWASGVTTVGQVMRAYTRTEGATGMSPGAVVPYHEYEFTTPNGRRVRFMENGRPVRAVGDRVVVYYVPTQPSTATAAAPALVMEAAKVVCVLLMLGVTVAMGVALVVLMSTS